MVQTTQFLTSLSERFFFLPVKGSQWALLCLLLDLLFFPYLAAGYQSHDSTRSQLACSAEPQHWPLGTCRHMALFCLMTVCACACLRLEGEIPGELADCHTPIKQNKFTPRDTCRQQKSHKNGNAFTLWLKITSFGSLTKGKTC